MGRAKNSKLTEEHRRNIGLGNKGKVRTLEMKKNYSKAKQGMKFTKKHKKNLSNSIREAFRLKKLKEMEVKNGLL
jgi:hypothetical protein